MKYHNLEKTTNLQILLNSFNKKCVQIMYTKKFKNADAFFRIYELKNEGIKIYERMSLVAFWYYGMSELDLLDLLYTESRIGDAYEIDEIYYFTPLWRTINNRKNYYI